MLLFEAAYEAICRGLIWRGSFDGVRTGVVKNFYRMGLTICDESNIMPLKCVLRKEMI